VTRRNVSALARATGRHRNTVSEWLRAGCPADVPGAVQWLEARAAERATAPLLERIRDLETQLGAAASDVTEGEARRRKRVAEAQLLELELEIKLGEYIHVDKHEELLVRLLSAMVARLRAIPATSAAEARAAATDAVCEAILRDRIDEALVEIAKAIRDAARRADKRAAAREEEGAA